MRHLKLTFPATYSPNPHTRFNQIISVLEQLCDQYKGKIPAFAWHPVSMTLKELTIILNTKSVHNNLTQRDDISVIHADKKRTFGKRYTLQVYPDCPSISLAVAGSSEFYDLFIDTSQDGNFLLSHTALLYRAGRKKLIELQLVSTPTGQEDNYMYSLSYRQPPKMGATANRSLKLMQLQQLSLAPELYVDKNSDGCVQKITAAEFEKMFGVKLLQTLSVAGDGADDIISDLGNISSSYQRLRSYIDGQLTYDAGMKTGSLRDVSQEALLDNIIAQVKNKKKPCLPRVVIVRVNDLVGYGLIAGEYIPAGRIIGEYCGEISKLTALDEAKQDNTYFAAYAPDQVPGSEMFVIDARRGGNSTRFINHSDKNANAAWMRVFDGKRFRSIIAAVKPIAEGKQILIKYKDSYWSAKRGGPSPYLPDALYPL